MGDRVAGKPVVALRVVPNGPAARDGIRDGDQTPSITINRQAFGDAGPDKTESLEIPLAGPRHAEDALRDWRLVQGGSGFARFAGADGEFHQAVFDTPPIWSMDNPPWGAWFRQHLGPLSQMTAFIGGALVLLLLGARGTTATLMTLALLATATANSGPLLGSEQVLPVIGPVLLIFNWLITAWSFPIIGLAVLFFPHRA